MTKAEQIRALYAKGHTVKAIAGMIGCRVEYVRVCARQRVNGKSCNADRNYRPKIRQAYKKGDREAARIAASNAYLSARKNGVAVPVAKGIAGGAYFNEMVKTGRQSSA